MTIKASGGWDVSILNDVHGSEKAPSGIYEVTVVRQWFDYETGQRYVGMVMNQSDVDRIALVGRTAYGPKDSNWDPSLVYFSDDAIVTSKAAA